MATTVDTLLVRIESDMSDIRRDLKRLETQTGQTTSKVKRSLNGMGNAFKAVLGGVLVAQLGRGTIALTKFASDMEEMSAMSEAVFGGFVHSVRSELLEFADAVGRSQFELEGMAASVQDTFVPLGFARGEAADLSVALTKLAVDVASFKNVSEKMTMDSFTSALVGNHETVRKFGVVIDEAAIKAELFRMGITKSYKEVDIASKVQARYNLIVAGTSDAHGDAARTAGSYANLSKGLDGELQRLAKSVGDMLLPSMKNLVITTRDAVKEFRQFVDATKADTHGFKMVKALEELTAAELNYAKALKISNTQSKASPAITQMLIDAEIRLNQAQLKVNLALTESVKVVEKKRNVVVEETKATEEQNLVMSDSEKFLKKLKESTEILTLEKDNASKLTILQKEAEHELGQEYKDNKKAIDEAISSNHNLNVTLDKREKLLTKIQELMNKAIDGQTKIKDTTNSLSEEYDLLEEELNGATEAELAFMRVQQEHVKLSPKQEKQIKALIEKNMAYRRVIDGNNRVNEKALSIVESMKTPMDELNEKLQILEAAYLNGAISADKLREAQEKIKQQMQELDPKFKALHDAAMQAADGISNALADAFVNGKFSLQSLGDVFKQVIKQMIADAIKAQIIKHLIGPMFMAMGIPMAAGGGSVNMGNTTLSHAGGGSISRYGRAGGGMAMPTLVGERGPELFVPHTAGVVRNNHDTKNMMGGGSPVVVNQNINIDAGVSQTVRAEVMSMMPRIKSETIQAMIDGKRRGNSISKAFA